MSTPVRATIATLIDQLFGVPADAITDEVALQDGLQLDSLSVVELQIAIEDAFDVRLDPGDRDITTFKQLVDLVAQATAATSGRAGTAAGAPDGADEARSA